MQQSTEEFYCTPDQEEFIRVQTGQLDKFIRRSIGKRKHSPTPPMMVDTSELNLPQRTFNLLTGPQFRAMSLGALLQIHDESLLAVPGFGERQLIELKAAIANYCLGRWLDWEEQKL